jgi:hypothetical protein
MDRLFRNDDVEVAIRKWNLPHVGGQNRYAVGNTFAPRIFERGVGMVAGEVFRLLDVDAGRRSGRKALGGTQKHEPKTATDIEHRLISPPRDQIELLLPFAEFADFA